ncbi:hypothetical protein PV326_000046 [Microctonus aethiopoides]|nr:hypothetical protein PV326_000046 [Microctonus aethiopoides]
MSMENLNVTILYGSETGTAQDTAEQIWKNAKRYGLKCCINAMDDYQIQNIVCERLIIFVVATTGQGECPMNMRRFWRFLLQKNLPINLLENLKYSVLGLGDSSYEKFNYAAKRLHKRIAQLGGTELLPIGLANDQDDLGIDTVIGPWSKELWNVISHEFNIALAHSTTNTDEIIERFHVNILDKKLINDNNEKHYSIYHEELNVNDTLREGRVIENIRTTAEDHFQDVRLIKFHIENINYKPGDLLYVRPRNSPKQIQNFFDLLKEHDIPLYPETIISITEKEIKLPLALKQPVTLKQIVEQYWDLNYKPRKLTMLALSSISDSEIEKEKLIEFSTAEGQEELYTYVNRPRRNIVEVLRDFPHTTKNLNIKILFEIMVPIKPRAFSIASSNLDTPNEIHLLVAVVKYKTNLIEPRLGLCSNWLASLRTDEKIICWIQKGTFKFDYDKPMILIGPGTGIAAFRSMLLDRAAMKQSLNDTILFFGCRYKNKDYHCQNDFEMLNRVNNLRIFCAFSRDQDDKIYVQHIIHEQRELCWQLLNKGGKVYLSGSSKNMPKSVREEFVILAKDVGKFNEVEAENFIRTLEKTQRYQTETWS